MNENTEFLSQVAIFEDLAEGEMELVHHSSRNELTREMRLFSSRKTPESTCTSSRKGV